MNRGHFLRLTGFSGIGFFSGLPSLSGYFDNVPPALQNFIAVCGIFPNPDSIGEKGVHLRWEFPPSKGFPDVINIYRKKSTKFPVEKIFFPTKKNLEDLQQWCSEKEEKGWEKVGKIDNNDFRDPDLVIKRISSTHAFNYYLPAAPASARSAALHRYRENAATYSAIFQALKEPSEEFFLVQRPYTQFKDIPVNELTFKPKNKSKAVLKPWNMLLFAAVDPNIARMLGLYFVDKSADPAGDVYDYKIEATYRINHETICGVVRQVGKDYSSRPQLQGNLISTQIETTWWTFKENNNVDQHFGKVRLSWPRPQEANANLQRRYTEPVIYALQKNNSQKKLVSPGADSDQLFVTDRETIVSSINYKISGIDIFGQESNALISTCILKDRDTPQPPVRLIFIEKSSLIKLRFEYGASQYLVAPDVKQFRVYQRNDVMHDSKRVRFTLLPSHTNNNRGNKIYTLTLQNAGDISSFQYVGFSEDGGGKKLPAADRKKFKISNSSGNTMRFICGLAEYTPPASGWVLLTRDANVRSNEWGSAIKAIPFILPTKLTFADSANGYTHFIRNTGDNGHFATENIISSRAFNCKAVKTIWQETEKDAFENSGSFEKERFTEILIDRELLLSDVFTQGKVKIGNEQYAILFQSSGIATPSSIQNDLDNDLKNKNKYARIIISGHINVPGNTPLKMSLPVAEPTENTSGNKVTGYLLLRVNTSAGISPTSGGEILLKARQQFNIEGQNELRSINIVARLCSDFYGTQQNEVLVHISKQLFNIDTTRTLSYFAPYETDITTRIKNPAFPIAPADAHRSTYFAVEAIDKTVPANASMLSSIAQFIKVRDAGQLAAPSKPYLCDDANATKAYLKPPDKDGQSSFCLQWDGSTDGIRYEVGRALDKTIIAVHRDLWLKGILQAVDPLTAGKINENNGAVLQPSSPDANTGIISATSTYGLGPDLPEYYKGGRLTQGSPGSIRSFEIIMITKEGDNLKLMLRSSVKGTLPLETSFKLEQLPDYTLVQEDDNKLIELANIRSVLPNDHIPDSLGAFSVVTGMPLRNSNRFLDSVAGTGNGRFFYKVRAVDASENRSAWSPASNPVYQLDTTPADVPDITELSALEQAALIRWRNEDKSWVKGYRIYRTNIAVPEGSPEGFSTENMIITFQKNNPPSGTFQPAFARIRHSHNTILLPLNDPLLKDTATVITGVFRVTNEQTPDLTANYLIPGPTGIIGQAITNLHPALSESIKLAVVLGPPGNAPETVITKNGTAALVALNGSLPLTGTIPPLPLKGVFRIDQYDPGVPANEQTAENYLAIHATTYNKEKGLLKNFFFGLGENEAVVVQITSASGAVSYIADDKNQYEYLDALHSVLTPDLNYTYRMEAFKQVPVENLQLTIPSPKTLPRIVQVSMNTPPQPPELSSIVWWDVQSNSAAGNSTAQYGVKLTAKVFDNRGIVIIKRFSKEKNMYLPIAENLTLTDASGPFYSFSHIIPVPAKNTEFFQVEFINNWGLKSSLNTQITGF